MAFGVPAIGSPVGGIPTIIRNGENGFLPPLTATPADLAALIRDTLASPQSYRRLGREARDDYRTRLNWDSFGARLNETVAALV
jgi:glycosyltransferase involved in cell wall biosynthesis